MSSQIIRKTVARFSHPCTDAKTLVIASDRSYLSLPYRKFLEGDLGLKPDEYFFSRKKGFISALANNTNGDRAHSFKYLNNILNKGVNRVLLLNDKVLTGLNPAKRKAKIEEREKTALAAKDAILLALTNRSETSIKIEPYVAKVTKKKVDDVDTWEVVITKVGRVSKVRSAC